MSGGAPDHAEGGRGTLATLLVFTAVSVAWSWPWAAFDGVTFPLRQFDLYGVLWVVEHARDLLFDLRSAVSALPDGEDVSRLDTWVLAFLAALLPAGVDPLRVAQVLVIVGPVASAFAAERCAARGLGVARPWSLVAGLVYGYSGLGATALLEGHVYYLLAPWPPLLAWALLAATGPGARFADGARAGLWWALALLTSAYLGIVATLLTLGLVARGAVVRLDRGPMVHAALGFVTVALPISVVYVAAFASGSGGVANKAVLVAASGSATLATLATWSPDIDLDNHSVAAPMGFVALALVLVAPAVLRARAGWRVLTALATLAVVLSLGPAIQSGMGGVGTWYWFDPIKAPHFASFIHFPVRFLWLWYLCAGLVAAQVAASLAARVGRPAWAILPLVVLDGFVTTAVPWRNGAIPTTIPDAYTHAPAGRPVLDLYAEDSDGGTGLELRVRRLACFHQTNHGRPLVGRCLTPHGALEQEAAERALREALLDGGDPRPALAGLDIGALVVHLDLFRREDRVRLRAGLSAAFGPPLGAATGLDRDVLLFRVDPPPADVAPGTADR